MLKLAALILWVCLLAHLAANTRNISIWRDGNGFNLFQFPLMIPMIGLIGLRTDYNDTAAYIFEFENAPQLTKLLSVSESLDLLENPLFALFTSAIRTVTDSYHVFFMIAAVLLVVLMVTFLREISDRDTYSLVLFTYFTLGTYFFALAAMKQTLSMAILCHSVLALRDKKHLRFLLLVLIAGLVHTYAWCFFIMILLTTRPWKMRTYAVIAVTLFIILTFNNSIATLLEYGNAIGKETSEELVFSGEGMNLLRVLVYSIVPVCSFIFRPILEPQMERKHYIMTHMSIISFMFMLLAAVDGANMFGRMARYFEVGTIYMFPWIVCHLFERKSQRLVTAMYVSAFSVFAVYQYHGFDADYRGISWSTFFQGLI